MKEKNSRQDQSPTFLRKLFEPDDCLDGACVKITKMSQLSWLRRVFVAYIVSHYVEVGSLGDDKKGQAEWEKLSEKLFGESDLSESWSAAMGKELKQPEMDELWRFHLAHTDPLYGSEEVFSLESKFRGIGSKPVMPVYVSIGELFCLYLYSGVADLDNGGFDQDERSGDGVYALFLIMRYWSQNNEGAEPEKWDEEKFGENPWSGEFAYIQEYGPELVGRHDEIEARRNMPRFKR